MVEGFAETERNAHYEIGTLILLNRNSSKRNTRIIKGTLVLSKEHSYYQRNTRIIKGTLVLSKGTHQKGTHQKGTLVLSKGTLLLLNRNTHIIKKELLQKEPFRLGCEQCDWS